MPLVSDPTNTRSSFPLSLDNLTLYTNGVGVNSVINGETWNNIMSAIYNIEKHTQRTLLFFDAADRHRVCISGTVSISPGTFTQLVVMGNFTAGQLAFLNGGIQKSGSMILADVIHLTGIDDCTTDVLLTPTTVQVYIHRTDPSQTFSGGSYLVNVTVLGI